MDGVEALELQKGITLLRGTCSSQLKCVCGVHPVVCGCAHSQNEACRYEIEYSLKRGSSDNCYLLKVRV